MINVEELKKCVDGEYTEGYRIVYFYDDGSYSIGTYVSELEYFMYDFVEVEPIDDEDEIPPFVSTKDVLTRSFQFDKDAKSIAIYSLDGELIDKLDSDELK